MEQFFFCYLHIPSVTKCWVGESEILIFTTFFLTSFRLFLFVCLFVCLFVRKNFPFLWRNFRPLPLVQSPPNFACRLVLDDNACMQNLEAIGQAEVVENLWISRWHFWISSDCYTKCQSEIFCQQNNLRNHQNSIKNKIYKHFF